MGGTVDLDALGGRAGIVSSGEVVSLLLPSGEMLPARDLSHAEFHELRAAHVHVGADETTELEGARVALLGSVEHAELLKMRVRESFAWTQRTWRPHERWFPNIILVHAEAWNAPSVRFWEDDRLRFANVAHVEADASEAHVLGLASRAHRSQRDILRAIQEGGTWARLEDFGPAGWLKVLARAEGRIHFEALGEIRIELHLANGKVKKARMHVDDDVHEGRDALAGFLALESGRICVADAGQLRRFERWMPRPRPMPMPMPRPKP